MLVVNEPELVEAVNRLRGEWAERSGGELKASGMTWKELSEAKEIDADVVIFPSRYLGEMCFRGWLRPVRTSVLESEALNSPDFFPLVRNEIIRWGGQVMAMPLGVDPTAVSPTADAPTFVSLLVLAASKAISNDRIGVLFDEETMKPRITDPAFVDALTQLTAGKGNGKSVQPKDNAPIPVLGYGDRLAAVTAASRNAASAFKLLEWLAQADTSSQLARTGSRQLPARRSLASAAAWHDQEHSATDRAERGKVLTAALNNEQSLIIPRIPGIDDYLAALEEAVKSVNDKKMPPAQALRAAAQKWEKITEGLGRDKQRDAYQKHLNVASVLRVP